MLIILEVEKCLKVRIARDDDIPAVPAVTPVRDAFPVKNILVEAVASISAASAADIDFSLIYQHLIPG